MEKVKGIGKREKGREGGRERGRTTERVVERGMEESVWVNPSAIGVRGV